MLPSFKYYLHCIASQLPVHQVGTSVARHRVSSGVLQKLSLITLITLTAFLGSCGAREGKLQNESAFQMLNHNRHNTNNMIDTLTFGAGCFWCAEAQLQQLKGVIAVKSGYSGGHTPNPTYKEICTGTTGHAEVIQVTFDNSLITLDEMLAAFWQSHDPTQLNRQGNDVGTQYRSVIFYRNEEQKNLAENYKKKLNDEQVYDRPIVTEISPLGEFYIAEDYHQNYYNLNSNQGYCQYVIAPKLEKFRKVFKEKVK